ncbi:MAG TPA: hypothetical protein VLS45_00050, partial [Methylomicrobium sp.]|nr:hypothetical protein [Methylomicrobium sp.]
MAIFALFKGQLVEPRFHFRASLVAIGINTPAGHAHLRYDPAHQLIGSLSDVLTDRRPHVSTTDLDTVPNGEQGKRCLQLLSRYTPTTQEGWHHQPTRPQAQPLSWLQQATVGVTAYQSTATAAHTIHVSHGHRSLCRKYSSCCIKPI